MEQKTETGTFKVPEGHAEVGTEKSFGFSYKVYADLDEVRNDKNEKGEAVNSASDLLKAFNLYIKGRARSNAYQNALAPYKPSEVSAEDIKERMVRDYIRLGVSEDVARKQVDALLAATAK